MGIQQSRRQQVFHQTKIWLCKIKFLVASCAKKYRKASRKRYGMKVATAVLKMATKRMLNTSSHSKIENAPVQLPTGYSCLMRNGCGILSMVLLSRESSSWMRLQNLMSHHAHEYLLSPSRQPFLRLRGCAQDPAVTLPTPSWCKPAILAQCAPSH